MFPLILPAEYKSMRKFIHIYRNYLPSFSAAIGLCASFVLGTGTLHAQDVPSFQLGFKGGVPITDVFSTKGGPTTQFGSADRRWIVGASGEFKLWGPFSLEADALYKRVGFDYSNANFNAAGPAYQSTVANWWEFPGLIKYALPTGRFHPFIDFGASLRHITSIRQTTNNAAFFASAIADNSTFLQHRNSAGAVFGIGAQVPVKHLLLTPEVRYTRWFNQAFGDAGNNLLRTNLDQVDVLIGFNFGK